MVSQWRDGEPSWGSVRWIDGEGGGLACFTFGAVFADCQRDSECPAGTSGTRDRALAPQQQSFGSQAVHADASFSGVNCQGTVGLRRDAKGQGASVAVCR